MKHHNWDAIAEAARDIMEPADSRLLAIKRARNHYNAAMDPRLSWDARVWHADMYEMETGIPLHLYVREGVFA